MKDTIISYLDIFRFLRMSDYIIYYYYSYDTSNRIKNLYQKITSHVSRE